MPLSCPEVGSSGLLDRQQSSVQSIAASKSNAGLATSLSWVSRFASWMPRSASSTSPRVIFLINSWSGYKARREYQNRTDFARTLRIHSRFVLSHFTYPSFVQEPHHSLLSRIRPMEAEGFLDVFHFQVKRHLPLGSSAEFRGVCQHALACFSARRGSNL